MNIVLSCFHPFSVLILVYSPAFFIFHLANRQQPFYLSPKIKSPAVYCEYRTVLITKVKTALLQFVISSIGDCISKLDYSQQDLQRGNM